MAALLFFLSSLLNLTNYFVFSTKWAIGRSYRPVLLVEVKHTQYALVVVKEFLKDFSVVIAFRALFYQTIWVKWNSFNWGVSEMVQQNVELSLSYFDGLTSSTFFFQMTNISDFYVSSKNGSLKSSVDHTLITLLRSEMKNFGFILWE